MFILSIARIVTFFSFYKIGEIICLSIISLNQRESETCIREPSDYNFAVTKLIINNHREIEITVNKQFLIIFLYERRTKEHSDVIIINQT